jgi:hypothetical protein
MSSNDSELSMVRGKKTKKARKRQKDRTSLFGRSKGLTENSCCADTKKRGLKKGIFFVLYVRAIGGHWVVAVEALDMLAGGTLGCLESIQLTVRACKKTYKQAQ